MSLSNLGNHYSSLENLEKAQRAYCESLEIMLPFYKALPTAFASNVKGYIRNYLRLIKKLNQQPDHEILKGFEPLLEQIKKEESAA